MLLVGVVAYFRDVTWYALVHLHVVGCVLLFLALIAMAMVSTWQRHVRYGESSKWLETTGGITTPQTSPCNHHIRYLTPNLRMLTLISNNLHTFFFLTRGAAPTKKTRMTTWYRHAISTAQVLRRTLSDFFHQSKKWCSCKPVTAVEFGWLEGWREGYTTRACCLKVPHDELLRTWKKQQVCTCSSVNCQRKSWKLHIFFWWIPWTCMDSPWTIPEFVSFQWGKILQLSEGGGPVETPKLTLTVHNKNTSYQLHMYMHTYPCYVLHVYLCCWNECKVILYFENVWRYQLA